MGKKPDSEDLLGWVRTKPELLERLERMRQIEQDEEDGDIERIELEMLELVRAIGAESFGRCVQSKEAKAVERAKAKGGGRIHGKKN